MPEEVYAYCQFCKEKKELKKGKLLDGKKGAKVLSGFCEFDHPMNLIVGKKYEHPRS